MSTDAAPPPAAPPPAGPPPPPPPRTPPGWVYPVRLVAVAEPAPGRWLWLVKWLLAIPHYVVLFFLWLAFWVLTVVAFFAILFTARYPRALFDFNVGVLRWTWRVGYYAYGALATDRYPPFSLDPDPSYPADLEVAYPQRLSRGLVLVKWWLLVLPHYVVLSLFLGTGIWWVQEASSNDWQWVWGGGLLGLLVLVAAVVLLFTGRYPRAVYDLVMGVDRWAVRVGAYAALMTDEYPPFRLDSGPGEPEPAPGTPAPGPLDPVRTAALAPAAGAAAAGAGPAAGAGAGPAAATAYAAAPPLPAATPSQPAATTTSSQLPPAATPRQPTTVGAHGRWTAGRVVLVLVGALLVVSSLGLLTAGVAGLAVDRFARQDGFLTTRSTDLTSGGYAVVAGDLVLDAPSGTLDRVVGDVRVRVDPQDPSAPVFVGIASERDAQAYLSGVARTEVGRGDRTFGGGPPPVSPLQAGIWVAGQAGTGTQELTWAPRSGDWALVVMNADGSRGVLTSADVGVTLPWLDDLAVTLLVVGVLVLAAGVVLLVLGLRTPRRPTAPAGPASPPAPGAASST